MEQDRKSRNKSTYITINKFLTKVPKHTMKKEQYLQKWFWEKLDIHIQKNEIPLSSYTIYENQFKVG